MRSLSRQSCQCLWDLRVRLAQQSNLSQRFSVPFSSSSFLKNTVLAISLESGAISITQLLNCTNYVLLDDWNDSQNSTKYIIHCFNKGKIRSAGKRNHRQSSGKSTASTHSFQISVLVTQGMFWMVNCQDTHRMPWSQESYSFIQGGFYI